MRGAVLLPATLVLLTALAACKKDPPPLPDPPKTVKVITVAPVEIAVANQFPGRLAAYRKAEVRARVAGIVTDRLYQEGQEVRAGSALFKIDPAALQATLEMRKAAFRQAQATLDMNADKARRYGALAKADAISRIDYAEALAVEAQAKAQVEEAKAAQRSAALELSYATVRSPIAGRARRALVTEGALVGQDSATPLTTIEQIDPIYVNFSQPAAVVAQMRKAIRAGELQGLAKQDIPVRLTLGDGSLYPTAGKLIFSDLAIDPATETIAMRAVIPNPKHILLPGGYVRVGLEQALNKSAILIPRDALLRTVDSAKVMVVDADNTVRAVAVTADTLHGDRWLVSAGLNGGEKVIVANVAKIEAGAKVTPQEQSGSGAIAKTEAKTETEAAATKVAHVAQIEGR
ncbi:efflux RND transporter periplasmic adaptor subunit [Oxalobacteraceae bacterium CAVE-383]|nr:efflux RND transporter periplasmic adaptor subunit [Oxalobacteraceae bacterium CAVE-383]